MTSSESSQNESNFKPYRRRNFLKVALATSVALVVASLSGIARALSISPDIQGKDSTSIGFPKIKVTNVSDLVQNEPIQFNYPLEETPNVIVKLGVKALGGVGPDEDVVAFSMICQHLGCIYGFVQGDHEPACNPSFTAKGPVGYCCCHGSIFDFANSATVLGGPSERPVPQVILEFDSSTGDLYAVGMTPPTIFGHNTGSNDVSADLQGGTLLS